MKVLYLLSSEYVVIVYLFMYYYVNVSVLLCGVAVWCIFGLLLLFVYFIFGNMFYCTDYDLFYEFIYKLALFVDLFFSIHV